jgi:GxxExxY protein
MVIDDITFRVIHCALAVHSAVGPGLVEKAYDACLCYELHRASLTFRRQVALPVQYREVSIKAGFRMDYLVEQCVILELKAVEKLHPLHTAQLLSYLKLSGVTVGLLINFNVVHLRDGIRRVVNRYQPEPQQPR